MSKKAVVKISKQGFSQAISTAFGNFGSWNIGNTSVEMEVDIDMTTDEGKEKFKKLSDNLFKLCLAMNKRDLELAMAEYPELRLSVEKKQKLIQNQLNQEGEDLPY